VLLGEMVTPLEVAGSLLILAGLVLNVFGPRLVARLRAA
jgi:O-acetylserine/cysteine efflux transporter